MICLLINKTFYKTNKMTYTLFCVYLGLMEVFLTSYRYDLTNILTILSLAKLMAGVKEQQHY